ncbi:thiol reductant ABC exporter subunit CydD [Subtercola frigoramans]|uniref:ATP-binding cassette subfamily C protein CydD n=1 Tax=Subtercola frigoramans TaxID=120298 RepID=A0ABS2L6G6_9MICO|nr:thiol reductant ABC exporter subunit CydD [Subtercola frigoramans]MBM7472638.1 ATP-binding cassette subfamily C protein CydD [Subtercola frigoramans]
MKPVDRRLLGYARSARGFFVVAGLLGLVQTACTVAFAWLVSSTVVAAIGGASVSQLTGSLAALAAVVVVRSGVIWLMGYISARAAAVVKGELRRSVLEKLPQLGSAWLSSRNSVTVSTVVTVGLDALDTYFSKYLPQLILTVIATPVVVSVLFAGDWVSGLTVMLTLPLVPVFMILIGRATESAQKTQWQKLGRLSSGFLDVVEGLSTLKIFGREKRQAERIRRVTDDYRTSTMSVLRLSFMSGFVLELAASLSVALLAVSVGLRLVDGSLGLGVGLFVLMLAPEAFLPLRQVGAQFHAAADGIAATDEVFEILDTPVVSGAIGSATVTSVGELPGALEQRSTRAAALDGLEISGLGVSYGEVRVLHDFAATFRAGELTVITGPSGAGKSTVVAAMLGFVQHRGSIRLLGTPGREPEPEPEPESARALAPGRELGQNTRPLQLDDVAWSGQRSQLLAGTIAENVTLGARTPDAALAARALDLAAASELDPLTALGVNGAGLSGGQSQRVSVARAIYRALDRGCAVLVLDEPSSALDAETEAELLRGLRELAGRGMIVICVSHRAAFRAAADAIVTVARPGDATVPAAVASLASTRRN